MVNPLPSQAPIAFVVEVGPQIHPKITVKVRDKEVAFTIPPAQAGELGRALLAVSAVCSSNVPHPEGTIVDNCHLPVQKWAAGESRANGKPILVVEIPGGAQLALEFAPSTAVECGQSLQEIGRTAGASAHA